jgi:hypothetical protein
MVSQIKKNNKKEEKKGYAPKDTVVSYFEDRLVFLEEERKIQEKRFAGIELTKKENEELRVKRNRMKQRKLTVLDDHIFPSMANLVVFFEYLSENQELREIFEDDVKELLVFKGQDAKYEDNIITRLLQSVLKWDSNKDPNNFRLELISSIQNVLFHKIISLSLMDNKLGDSMTNGIVGPDVGRALLWARNFSSRYGYSSKKDDQTEEPRRPIKF